MRRWPPLLLAVALAGASEAPRAAIAAAERGDWPAAVAACARDFDRAEADERFWLLYGRAAVEAGDARLAAALVEGALVRFPGSDDVRRLELAQLSRARRPLELGRAAEAWLARHPDDADTWLARAWAERELGDEAGACAGLEAALLLRPGDRALRRQLAELQRGAGLPRAALAHFRLLMQGEPDANLRRAAATCAGEAGDPRLGLSWLSSDTREDGLLRARLAIQAGDEALAASALDAVIAGGEGDPRVLLWAGHLAEMRRDLPRAEACYAQAAAADPAGAAVLRLADLYRRTGRADQGRALLERHLADHPEDAAARAMLGAGRGEP